MNDLLKERLQNLVNDELTLTALRAAFDEAADKEKPRVESLVDDSLLGQKFRAYEAAKKIIEQTFIDLASYKVKPKNTQSFNKAR